eukprot:TRINITY_DN4708_c0_g1_i1.p1 TRINITY_DN4708_c0_g1~~TRINITY_DN4708_c0_g1_i1.p1  ORF type:complete len:502 (-),score=171.60 TRINITY_DN4708_c0_g1_i1:81-1586(-)
MSLKPETDNVTGFTVLAPADWTRDEQPAASMKIVQWTPPGVVPDFNSPPCMILLQIHQTHMSEEKYYQASLEQLRQMDQSIEPKSEFFNVGELRARRITWSNPVVHTEQVTVGRAGFIFVYGFTAGAKDFQKYSNVVSECMKSIQFGLATVDSFDPISWKTEKNIQYGYELEVPIFFHNARDEDEKLFPPTRHLVELNYLWFGATPSGSTLRVILAVENASGITLDKYAELYLTQLKKETVTGLFAPEATTIPLKNGDKTVGEMKAFRINYVNVGSAEKTEALLTIVDDELAYVLTLSSTSSAQECREEPILKRILGSLALLDRTPGVVAAVVPREEEVLQYENAKENIKMSVRGCMRPTCSFEEGTDFFRWGEGQLNELEYTPCINLAVKDNVDNKTLVQIAEEMIGAMEGAKVVSNVSLDSFLGAEGLDIVFVGDVPAPAQTPAYGHISLQFKQRFCLKNKKLYCLMFTAKRDSFKADYANMAKLSFETISFLEASPDV